MLFVDNDPACDLVGGGDGSGEGEEEGVAGNNPSCSQRLWLSLPKSESKNPRLPQGPSSLPWIIHDELAGGYDWPKGSCTVNSLSFGGSQWAILLTHLLPEILKTGPAT